MGSSRDSNSISLSWSPPLLSERNGLIQYYLVNVTETDTGMDYGHVSLSTNFTLFALHPFYTYVIMVTSVTVGPGPATNPIMVTTDQDSKQCCTQWDLYCRHTFYPIMIATYAWTCAVLSMQC